MRPEDEAPVDQTDGEGEHPSPDADGTDPGTPSARRAIITVGGSQPDAEDEEDDGIKPLPDRLVMELTAHRTLALRDAVASNPHVAMTALLHKLCVDAFHNGYAPGCMEVAVRQVHLPVQAPGLNDSASAKAVDERHDVWKADMPKDDDALWNWLAALDEASRSTLLAHCVSYGVNALFEKVDRYGGNGVSSHGLRRRLDQADRLARAVNLDMVEAGWRPTVENYLGRVTKSRILEAVREGKGESSAQLIDHLKKTEMAKEAERLLDGADGSPSRCVSPRPLRRPTALTPPASRSPNSSPMTRTKRPTRATTSIRTLSPPNDLIQRGGSGRPASFHRHLSSALAPGFIVSGAPS